MTNVTEATASASSALEPAGPAAQSIADIWWMMVGVFGLVFAIVMALLFVGLILKRDARDPKPPFGDGVFVIVGGLVVPGIILAAFLIYTLVQTASLRMPETDLTIEVTGNMWWWDVRYPSHDITIANEIYVPVGKPVRIEMRSNDVIHSLWIPSLSGKTDLIPGHKTVHWFEASRPGRYRGQCAEFCGVQHAKMAIIVMALSPSEFEDWLENKKSPPPLPKDPVLLMGHKTFFNVGCAECHTIRGAGANGKIGPDLTHIGSRLSLGAGAVENTHGNLAGWISNPQAIKPGNKMPPTLIESESFHALVSYLRSLK